MKKILCVLVCFAAVLFAQANDDAVIDAKKAFKSKGYLEVERIYKKFADTASRSNPAFEQLKPLYIESLSFLKKYRDINDLAVSFITDYPNSNQLGRVYYLWGVAKANTGDFVQAVVALDEGVKAQGKDKNTAKAITDLVKLISDRYISTSDRQKALAGGLSSEVAAILSAGNSYEEKKSIGAGGTINKTIGLLIPITGEYSDLGLATLNTVNMIVEQHEKNTGEKINVRVYDTESNSVRSAIRARELLNDKINMVIGPVMSNSAIVAAAVLSEHPKDAVMLTPTATDDGIAALGKNIFQLNLTPKALAEKIAVYAVEDLGINRFSILAPLNEYGRIMNKYFSDAVTSKGAVIEFMEYFSPDASDHRKQFNAMREYFTEIKFPDTISKPKTQFLTDSTITLGGLFLPVSSVDNAIQLAAQVPFHKIRAQILGANIWDNPKVIFDGKTTVQNINFSSSQKIDGENPRFKKFADDYTQKFGEAPNTVVAPLVADATTLMINAMAESKTVDDIIDYLSKVRGFAGISSEISFSDDGSNSAAAVMKISGSKVVRVK